MSKSLLMCELSDAIKQIKMHGEFTETMVGKNENLIFHQHFLNMDISLPITYKSFKFSTCIHEIWMQGKVSQNFDLGPSFDFMKCRNLIIKKG